MARDKNAAVEKLKFPARRFEKPKVLEISEEAWNKPGVRVAGISRPFWRHRGARVALILLAIMRAVLDGCHYIVIVGGLVDRKYVESRIKEVNEQLTSAQRRNFPQEAKEQVLDEIAQELNAILPRITPPSHNSDDGNHKRKGVDFVRYYIIPSLLLDGGYGREIVLRLMKLRPDIRLYDQGYDFTHLKGVGVHGDEKKIGQRIGWIAPRKHRLPSQYASAAPEREIREVEAAEMDDLPVFWGVGGFGSSVSRPGGGDRTVPYASLPACHIPEPSVQGEPATLLNQIGLRVIEVHPDGEEKLIRTWSFRDLVKQERMFITGIKTGAQEIHKRIVEALKSARQGLHIGELADILDEDREIIEKEITFLLEPKALARITWPGLYQDAKSQRFNFHRDWLQEKLKYSWDYDKDFFDLRRLLTGCVHIGYNTTDYEFIRWKMLEILQRFSIEVLEICGDVVGGLKHDMIHKGQILSALNYTEQAVFAAEIFGTIIYDIFRNRFEQYLAIRNSKEFSSEELTTIIKRSLILLLLRVGNHDDWVKENGHIPLFDFHSALIALLRYHIEQFLHEKGLHTPLLEDIVRSKSILLPEHHAVYEFEGGIRTELLHAYMGRTKTGSLRIEEALSFSRNCQLVDLFNFHTAVSAEIWRPDLGQIVGIQGGAMCVWTYFELTKMKRIDFGPVYSRVLHKNSRIFMSEHIFFNRPTSGFVNPLPVHTDVNQLKEKLKLLRSPMSPDEIMFGTFKAALQSR